MAQDLSEGAERPRRSLNPTEGYAKLNGLQMSHKTRGGGEPLVLSHADALRVHHNTRTINARDLQDADAAGHLADDQIDTPVCLLEL